MVMHRTPRSRRQALSLRTAAVACALALGTFPAFAQNDAPPTARTADVVDHVFGVTLHDPYRWMEGEHNAEFRQWLAAQGQYTRARLDALPTLKAWQQTLQKTSGASVVHRGQRFAGGRLFFIRQTAQGSGTLMVREADGTERVLLDPGSDKSDGGHASITLFVPSP